MTYRFGELFLLSTTAHIAAERGGISDVMLANFPAK